MARDLLNVPKRSNINNWPEKEVFKMETRKSWGSTPLSLSQIILGIFLIGFLTAPSFSQIGTAQTVTIKGTVAEDPGMLTVWLPLEGAMVVVSEGYIIYVANGTTETTEPVPYLRPLDTAYADKDGNYNFDPIKTTGYSLTLTASNSGYVEQNKILMLGGTLPPVNEDSNGNPDNTHQVNFLLKKIKEEIKVEIAGEVRTGSRDNSGPGKGSEPVGGAFVFLYPIGDGGVISYGDPIRAPNGFSGTTNSEGQFLIIGSLENSGWYLITISAQGFHSFTDTVKLVPGEKLTVPTVYLEPFTTAISPVSKISKPGFLKASPNPFVQSVQIEMTSGTDVGSATLNIFSLEGKKVFSEKAEAGNGKTAFHWNGRSRNGRILSPGVYLAVVSKNGVIAAKQRLVYRR